jgi:hypothetical protein
MGKVAMAKAKAKVVKTQGGAGPSPKSKAKAKAKSKNVKLIRLTKAVLKEPEMTLDEKMALFANGGKGPELTQDEWRAVNGRFKTAVSAAEPEVKEQWKAASESENKNKTKRSLMIGWLTDDKNFGAVYHSFVKQLNISRKVVKKEKWMGRQAAQAAGGYDTDEFEELVDVGAIAKRLHPRCAKITQYCDMYDYEKVVEVDRRQSISQTGRKTLDALNDDEVHNFEAGFKNLSKHSEEQLAGLDIDGLICTLTGEEPELPTVDILARKGKKAIKDSSPRKHGRRDDDVPKPPEDKVDNTDKALAKCKAMLSVLTQKSTAVESFLPSLKGAACC